jgi:hypothetical protein
MQVMSACLCVDLHSMFDGQLALRMCNCYEIKSTLSEMFQSWARAMQA